MNRYAEMKVVWEEKCEKCGSGGQNVLFENLGRYICEKCAKDATIHDGAWWGFEVEANSLIGLLQTVWFEVRFLPLENTWLAFSPKLGMAFKARRAYEIHTEINKRILRLAENGPNPDNQHRSLGDLKRASVVYNRYIEFKGGVPNQGGEIVV